MANALVPAPAAARGLVEELPNGVRVHQVTDGPGLRDNIYCEYPYVTADGRSFVYQEHEVSFEPGQRKAGARHYVLCRLGTWEKQVVGYGHSLPIITRSNRLYFVRRRPAGGGAGGRAGGGEEGELVRVDLGTLREEVVAAPLPARIRSIPSVSADERYAVYGVALSFAPQMFAIERTDLHTGARKVICEDPFICNPHTQLEPRLGRILMVQHNRNCAYAPDGKQIRLVGDPGATIFLVDIETCERTELPVGEPYTTRLTGHQAWAGGTGEIVMTIVGEGRFTAEHGGNVLALSALGPPPANRSWRQIAHGEVMNHIGTSPCGRLFHADGQFPDRLIVGNVRSGKAVHIGPSRTSYSVGNKFGQSAHAHANLTPDFRWLIFNSDRTGTPQIHAAEVPRELIECVL